MQAHRCALPLVDCELWQVGLKCLQFQIPCCKVEWEVLPLRGVKAPAKYYIGHNRIFPAKMMFRRIPTSEMYGALWMSGRTCQQLISLSTFATIFFWISDCKTNTCSLYKTHLTWGERNVGKYKENESSHCFSRFPTARVNVCMYMWVCV